MMIDKRLIGTVGESKRYIAGNVLAQWCALAANIVIMADISLLLERLYHRQTDSGLFLGSVICLAAALIVRFVCSITASRMSFLAAKTVKKKLRGMIYRKLLELGASYREKVKTSEVVQVAVEGVDQLETYFGSYLPQFFYAMLAPLTLFAVLAFVNLPAAAVLLICVPLIPVSIAAVQTWAKKLLGRYWGKYTALGDTFLENLQGLTTLKIYQADEFKHQEMNEASEEFRKITMKVLTMQLNSITIMDLIAYGGAALGVIMAVTQCQAGHVGLAGCLMIILLSADFFLPMRQLGSFFHIAMNGMAASDKIFRLIDLADGKTDANETAKTGERAREEKGDGESVKERAGKGGERMAAELSGNGIFCRNLCFSYEPDREILRGVNLMIPEGKMTALVGESGCGKSTLAALFMGRNRGYTGSILLDGRELSTWDEKKLLEKITYIGHDSHLFKGTVRGNLAMAKEGISDAKMWEALELVKLRDFLETEQGLNTKILENGSNLSGGQRQRLALARALLRDSPVYIFDEATSNIDVESENAIMEQIARMRGDKTILLISHRLANVVDADTIYVLSAGEVAESGTHGELLDREGVYEKLYHTQKRLENLEETTKAGTVTDAATDREEAV